LMFLKTHGIGLYSILQYVCSLLKDQHTYEGIQLCLISRSGPLVKTCLYQSRLAYTRHP